MIALVAYIYGLRLTDKLLMTSSPKKVTEKYNCKWPTDNLIDIEIGCIVKGGQWRNKAGEVCGQGLYHHYKELQKFLWPQKEWHKWNERLLSKFIQNRIIAILGPASSGKTREAADYALCRYICFPNETSVLVTSTDMRSLDLRIWGEIKKNWMSAKAVYPKTPGHAIGSRQTILTDAKDALARDFRNGLIGIPTLVGGQYQGLSKFVGIKNKYVILIADELQFMPKSFCDSISNLNKNEGFQCLGMGNPKDRTDALGILSEPSDESGGWDGMDESEITKEWTTRFENGICVQLVGTDSPNFDFPEDQPTRYPFLISRKAIQTDLDLYGRDSIQFSMMNLGMMPKDAQSRRVITRSLCVQYKALEEPVWQNEKITKIFGLDAAYGNVGGDRCVGVEMWLGYDTRGVQIISVKRTVIIPVTSKNPDMPEDQIADYVKNYCTEQGIPSTNVFYDATGKGSLGTSFARRWSPSVNPIEFGGKPTNRPVMSNSKILCKDYYSKFVSELWYSVRHAIESEQFRGMTDEIMNEGIMREWTIVSGNKIEVEPKDMMKKRMGRSPDIFDSLCLAVEGARRLGFNITKMISQSSREQNHKWISELLNKRKTLNSRNNLLKT